MDACQYQIKRQDESVLADNQLARIGREGCDQRHADSSIRVTAEAMRRLFVCWEDPCRNPTV